ncbi:hypothetical protein GCM10023189_19150 [Nibrella saemangeumensis]|uniref:Carboxypeptidase regulatory-like domain-containing protein n=1 Tax=Nibrella saemangeumensis TaxID=1084526 RepID=A0ABP8MPF3_9BACT
MIGSSGYDVTFLGTSNKVWEYNITRIADNNIEGFSFNLGNCITEADVIDASLYKPNNNDVLEKVNPLTYTKTTDGNGNLILTVDGIGNFSPGKPWKFTFELGFDAYQSVGAVGIVIKGEGNVDMPFGDSMEGPGCAPITGTVSKAACATATPSSYSNVTVTAGPGSLTAVTDGSGNYSISGLRGGTVYTLSITTPDNVASVISDPTPATATVSATTSAIVNFTALTGTVCQNGCSMSQGYYFAKPASQEALSYTYTLGGKVYTLAEARAIWNTSNGKGMLDIKKAFLQASTIILSGSSVQNNATVMAYVNQINTYLLSKPKIEVKPNGTLNVDANSTTTKPIGTAGGEIGKWIQANHCAYSDFYKQFINP